jgi:hypothetical protein
MDSEKSLTLNWCDPIIVSRMWYPEQNETGIYIWGFTINNTFVPYYVGIAENIALRISEHISSILSGKYIVFHSNSLAAFIEYKDQDVRPDKNAGKIYNPTWPRKYKDFLDSRKVLQPHIDFMVDTFTFSFATIDRELVSTQDLKEVEKICINQIGKENLINTRAGSSDKLTLNHIGSSIVTANFLKSLP